MPSTHETWLDPPFDYVVVGSGAGGGPLAANLARAGFRVLLMDAGGDEDSLTYAVPGFNGLATEDTRCRWDYYVRHYADDAQQARDPKYVASQRGVLYPRAGALGGCTAHHAMITVYPSNSDWDRIATATGDESWRADAMRPYFEKLERCEYLSPAQIAATRHGSSGWLVTEKADTEHSPQDWQLQATLQYAIGRAGAAYGLTAIDPLLDPNAWSVAEQQKEGYLTIPIATHRHARRGPRELLREVQRQFPDRLTIWTGVLATRVLFADDEDVDTSAIASAATDTDTDSGENRAVGVEYLSGRHLYRADPNAGVGCAITTPSRGRVRATREVILAAGAFNTPQLLMLSGIGPRDHLAAHGITVRADLPGVGRNLQDRYEVGVVFEMAAPWTVNADATFNDNRDFDPALAQWQQSRTGPYTSSGAALAFLKRSHGAAAHDDPDLFVFGFTTRFQGYFPLYFSHFASVRNQFTWCILKAHTRNTAGVVTLRSADPLDRPAIDFHYFQEGSDALNPDLDAVVDAIGFARGLMAGSPYVTRELLPGPQVADEAALQQWVRDQAWGHHGSCTCKIGGDADPHAVLDSRFRVRKTQGLRVVDASVFPHIPGTFIVLPIYMISEKAADAIIEDARQTRGDARQAVHAER